MMRNETVAEDMAQEIFLRIWNGLPGYNGKASLSTWIYTISRNTCLTELSRQARRPTISLDEKGAEDSMPLNNFLIHEPESAGKALDIQHYLDQLPEKYRRVVVLFYLEQKSYEETSQMLGLPIGTVKTFLYRAKRELLKFTDRNSMLATT